MSAAGTPIADHDLAVNEARLCQAAMGRPCRRCWRVLRNARLRLALSLVAYIMAAVGLVLIVWALIVLFASVPAPVDMQLPTL